VGGRVLPVAWIHDRPPGEHRCRGILTALGLLCLLFEHLIQPRVLSHALVIGMVVASISWAVYWWFFPWPTARQSAALFALADIGVIVVLLLAGVLVGVSSGAYWGYAVLVAIGSVVAGFEHQDGWGGADRGLVAGFIYGVALLLAHAIIGTHAKVSLGSFPPLLAVITAIAGMLLSALGGRIARQQRARRASPG